MIKQRILPAVWFSILFILSWVNVGSAEVKIPKIPVRIGGELNIYGVHRDNFDLKEENDDEDNFVMSITRFDINVDMAKNISSQVRLTHQSDWDAADANSDVEFELANIKAADLFNKHLTLIAGRQMIRWGRGFFIGKYPIENTPKISEQEMTAFLGFDAVRAILSYLPWNIDIFISNFHGTRMLKDKADLYGINVGRKFKKYDSEMEGYFLATLIDEGFDATIGSRKYEASSTYSFGLRGSMKPISGLELFSEAIYQIGTIEDLTPSYFKRDKKAYAFDLGGDYTFKLPWSPKLGMEYMVLSGGKANSDSDYNQYSGKYGYTTKPTGWIRSFQGIYYKVTVDPNDTGGNVNNRAFQIRCSLKPTQKTTIETRYSRSYFMIRPVPDRSRHAGDEIDTWLKYQLNKNIGFELMTGFLFPGEYYDEQPTETSRSADTATLIMGSVTIKY